MKSTYSEKLRDPRWQRKRLEIMSRDNFSCQNCGSTTETLNVHHKAYLPKTQPWDYADHFLVTLCERCHESIEVSKIDLCVWLGGDSDRWNLLSQIFCDSGGYLPRLCACLELLKDESLAEKLYDKWLKNSKVTEKCQHES